MYIQLWMCGCISYFIFCDFTIFLYVSLKRNFFVEFRFFVLLFFRFSVLSKLIIVSLCLGTTANQTKTWDHHISVQMFYMRFAWYFCCCSFILENRQCCIPFHPAIRESRLWTSFNDIIRTLLKNSKTTHERNIINNEINT